MVVVVKGIFTDEDWSVGSRSWPRLPSMVGGRLYGKKNR